MIRGFFGELIAGSACRAFAQGVLNLQDRITGAIEAELAREPR